MAASTVGEAVMRVAVMMATTRYLPSTPEQYMRMLTPPDSTSYNDVLCSLLQQREIPTGRLVMFLRSETPQCLPFPLTPLTCPPISRFPSQILTHRQDRV